MTIKQLPAIRAEFLSDSDSLFEFNQDDPRKVIPLSLEYQKKKSKQLLKQLRSDSENNPLEWVRIKKLSPKSEVLTPETIKLSDVQWLMAKEEGFSSWAALKHHIEASKIAIDAIQSNHPTSLDSDKNTLHIRCGSDVMLAMAIAGFSGDFLSFADPYVLGAVPQTETEEVFVRVRAEVVSYHFEGHQQAYEELSKDYAALRKACEYERLMFWFEHDAYDVLALIKLLHYFSDINHRPADIQFICVTSYPGVKRFNGIGQLPAEAMRVLWDQFTPVTESQFEFGKQAWEAFTQSNPQSFQQLAFSMDVALPVVVPAMKRQLQELPWLIDGLSLSERLTLQILSEKGSLPATALFYQWYTLHYEPLTFLGDSMYWIVLDSLAQAKRAAINFEKPSQKIVDWQVSLTSFGEDLLAGEAHWIESNGYDRWFGGTHNTSNQGCWYWDEKKQDVILS